MVSFRFIYNWGPLPRALSLSDIHCYYLWYEDCPLRSARETLNCGRSSFRSCLPMVHPHGTAELGSTEVRSRHRFFQDYHMRRMDLHYLNG